MSVSATWEPIKPAPPVTQMVRGDMDAPLSPQQVLALDELAPAFYQRSTVEVARELLGCLLLRVLPDGLVAVRLTEVEAYLGLSDPAAHTYRGRRTARNASMWRDGGHLYVYFTYGMHHCANVVTRREGEPEAVLLRGGDVVVGHDAVRRRRHHHLDLQGPAKLCQGLGIDRTLDGAPLKRAAGVWIAHDGLRPHSGEIVALPRVGVGYAGEAAAWPLRFVLRLEPRGGVGAAAP